MTKGIPAARPDPDRPLGGVAEIVLEALRWVLAHGETIDWPEAENGRAVWLADVRRRSWPGLTAATRNTTASRWSRGLEILQDRDLVAIENELLWLVRQRRSRR
jgi:hypothetical protein